MDDLPRPIRPRPNAIRWIRTVFWVVLATVVCMGGCVAMGLHSLTWDPPPSPEAKALEQVLADSPIQDLGVPGLQPIEQGSDPGRRSGSGDFQLGDEVSAYRSYAFTGELVATCQGALDHLLGRGWVLAYPDFEKGCADVHSYERYDGGETRSAHVSLQYVCGTLTVTGQLDVNVDVDSGETDAQKLWLVIEVAYPEPSGNGTDTTAVPTTCS